MDGNWNESLRFRFAYGVSAGPTIVAFHFRRFSADEGNAETPGVPEHMICMSSV